MVAVPNKTERAKIARRRINEFCSRFCVLEKTVRDMGANVMGLFTGSNVPLFGRSSPLAAHAGGLKIVGGHKVFLDTSFLVALAKEREPFHGKAERIYVELCAEGAELFISTIVVSEFAVKESMPYDLMSNSNV